MWIATMMVVIGQHRGRPMLAASSLSALAFRTSFAQEATQPVTARES
jgi:hypothetical protein